MNYRVILGGCLLVALCQSAFAAKVYTWTDEKGVTHYGEHPPQGATAKKINARTGHSEPVPIAPSETSGTDQADAQQPQQQQLKDPEHCEIARKNLETLDSNAPIKVPGENGNLRLITTQERTAKYTEMRRIVAENCE